MSVEILQRSSMYPGSTKNINKVFFAFSRSHLYVVIRMSFLSLAQQMIILYLSYC